ncbi:MAG: 6-phosphofructokinase, partial [Zetaproteobacteria bacterium CG_4_8_14_3_um_filter_59_5]
SAPYASEYFMTPLASVARETTAVADAYINAAGNDVTDAWLDYVRPLVGDLPEIGRL